MMITSKNEHQTRMNNRCRT